MSTVLVAKLHGDDNLCGCHLRLVQALRAEMSNSDLVDVHEERLLDGASNHARRSAASAAQNLLSEARLVVFGLVDVNETIHLTWLWAEGTGEGAFGEELPAELLERMRAVDRARATEGAQELEADEESSDDLFVTEVEIEDTTVSAVLVHEGCWLVPASLLPSKATVGMELRPEPVRLALAWFDRGRYDVAIVVAAEGLAQGAARSSCPLPDPLAAGPRDAQVCRLGEAPIVGRLSRTRDQVRFEVDTDEDEAARCGAGALVVDGRAVGLAVGRDANSTLVTLLADLARHLRFCLAVGWEPRQESLNRLAELRTQLERSLADDDVRSALREALGTPEQQLVESLLWVAPETLLRAVYTHLIGPGRLGAATYSAIGSLIEYLMPWVLDELDPALRASANNGVLRIRCRHQSIAEVVVAGYERRPAKLEWTRSSATAVAEATAPELVPVAAKGGYRGRGQELVDKIKDYIAGRLTKPRDEVASYLELFREDFESIGSMGLRANWDYKPYYLLIPSEDADDATLRTLRTELKGLLVVVVEAPSSSVQGYCRRVDLAMGRLFAKLGEAAG